ncbi:DUF4307 domain-containing protein [Microbacteriaceae bacterium VKM Ac-2854]|nr:DUF4307 domain-containing protein [Microbacteriaceae bacterium VKM Ac-2854]
MAVDPHAPAVVHPDADATTVDPAPTPPALAARYGRTPRTRRQNRWIFGAVAAAFVLVFAAWVSWAAFDGDNGDLSTTDIAHTVIDDRTVSVTFLVVAPTDAPYSCAIQALNERSAVVGWKVVEYPAIPVQSQQYTETLRTTELATTGLIYRCWLS